MAKKQKNTSDNQEGSYVFKFIKYPGILNNDEIVLVGVEKTKTGNIFYVELTTIDKTGFKTVNKKQNLSLHPNNPANSIYYKQISNYLIKKAGFKGSTNYQNGHDSKYGFYTHELNRITLTNHSFNNAMIDGNVYDLESTIGHEIDHSIFPINNFLEHAQTYLRQSLTNTSLKYKLQNAEGFITRIFNAYTNPNFDRNLDRDGIDLEVKKYNKAREKDNIRIGGVSESTMWGLYATIYIKINGKWESTSFKYRQLHNRYD